MIYILEELTFENWVLNQDSRAKTIAFEFADRAVRVLAPKAMIEIGTGTKKYNFVEQSKKLFLLKPITDFDTAKEALRLCYDLVHKDLAFYFSFELRNAIRALSLCRGGSYSTAIKHAIAIGDREEEMERFSLRVSELNKS